MFLLLRELQLSVDLLEALQQLLRGPDLAQLLGRKLLHPPACISLVGFCADAETALTRHRILSLRGEGRGVSD